MTYAFVDTETSSVDTSSCGVLQIGCIVADDQFNILEEFCTKCQLGKDRDGQPLRVDPKALEVNGIKLEDLKDAPTELEALTMLNKVMSKHNVDTICGFNTSFDVGALKSVAFRNRSYLYGPGMFIDLQMTCHNQGLYKYSLKSTCDHFGVINEKAHDALSDCRATLEIAKKVLQ